MSKIMTKEPRVVLSGRYDREGCRTRVVIPGYRLGQCVNMAHWPEQSIPVSSTWSTGLSDGLDCPKG